ncbi:FAD-dependent 5-carboxymethylaminomethyl-2-thiouridine(34) oxidoreductase MnmC [Variovorax sp. RHLX14]|uniref:FAD-dependent 5-carboxymethylaminomethyl-2-thiouridine(34) oxidoreductase MnmC n=1 Tax=Variovorax sp. RHLX14 TaxID=1259731 RepID=UPI003F44B668
MNETVDWRADGVPQSVRFGDIYHTETSALAQSRHVFIAGCDLPAAWAGSPQWRILETGFGFGLNFLACWQAWRDDPSRPRMLHFVSIEAHPVAQADLLRAAAAYPELADLAAALAAQWHGLLPGFHRMSFDDGRVLLTLCIGDVQPTLRAQRFEADSIFLDGFSPTLNPAMWSPEMLKAVSRFARQGTRIATWTIARTVRDALAQNGFQVRKAPGLPPKRDCLRGEFAPTWTVRHRTPPDAVAVPGRCAVIGAGLAGAAVAASLARRGWQVCVFDAADRPAAGASGLPVGVFAPHVSPDDALLSRLTRAGLRMTWQELERRLSEGTDWRASGVLEKRPPGDDRLPPGWRKDGPNESWHADAARIAHAELPPDTVALWHARAGWAIPARLVAAWLAQPGIATRTGQRISRIEAETAAGTSPTVWRLHAADGSVVTEADRIVIAGGYESAALAPDQPLQPVRGQIAWGRTPTGADGVDEIGLPPMPINGDGHLIAQVPLADGIDGTFWLTGATFDRDRSDNRPSEADTAANRERLARLHPGAASVLAGVFESADVGVWAGVRCASADRRPLVGPQHPALPQGPWLCTAMGSRGLSFAALCAELLAARWHGEPLPLPAASAAALDTARSGRRKDAS